MGDRVIAVEDLDAVLARLEKVRAAAALFPPLSAIVDRHGPDPVDSPAVAAHWAQRERRLAALAQVMDRLHRDVDRFADEARDAVQSLWETDRVLADDLTTMVRQLDEYGADGAPR